MLVLKSANLAIRFILELCALASLGYWGFHSGSGTFAKLGMGLGAPILAMVIWGAFVAPKASIAVSAPVHILLEIAVLGGAAAALYAAGSPGLSVAFAVIVVANRVLMSIWEQ